MNASDSSKLESGTGTGTKCESANFWSTRENINLNQAHNVYFGGIEANALDQRQKRTQNIFSSIPEEYSLFQKSQNLKTTNCLLHVNIFFYSTTYKAKI